MGIIPAYAGSTLTITASLYGYADHPRIRGEHRRQGLIVGQGTGSSPHTRGALLAQGAFVFPFRIIPAYAGST